MKRWKRGATLIELMVVMAVVGLLAQLIGPNLFRSHQRATLSTAKTVLVSDVRAQQLLAMQGHVKQAGVYIDYSVRFESDRYILYPGSVYDSQSADNRIIMLEGPLRFANITFAASTLSFARLSGEVRNYDSNANSVTLTNTQTAQSYVISVNPYGVVDVQ